MTETSAPYTATVCETCGGSGEVEVEVIEFNEHDDRYAERSIPCDNCAGSGWEPPEWKDDGSQDDAEDSGFVEPLDDSV